MQRLSVCGVLSHSWSSSVPVTCCLLFKEVERLLEPDWGRLERSSVFWTWWNHCTHELTEAVVVCRRPACGQASQCPNIEHGWSRKASYCSSVEHGWSCRLPSLAKTLLTADGIFGRGNWLSLRM